MRMFNRTRGATLVENGAVADSAWKRLRGLLGRPALPPGDGLLFPGTKAIHTIGMRFAIDVLFLNREGRVVRALRSLAPFRASPIAREAACVLELPAGMLERTGTQVGDEIELANLNPGNEIELRNFNHAAQAALALAGGVAVAQARAILAAAVLLAVFVMALRGVTDPDFWWHLRTGQYIVETRALPRVDLFSYTRAGESWVTHEWLSEVLIYALYRLGSFPALSIAFAAMVAAAFALVFARSEGKPYVAVLTLLLAAASSAVTWGVRPQMFTLFLASAFLFILERHWGDRWLWLLVPLMVLWVNLHSGYAVGLVIIAVYMLVEAAAYFASRIQSGKTCLALKDEERRAVSDGARFPQPSPDTLSTPLRAWLRLALVFVLCLLAVPLNSNGMAMYAYPFETLTSRVMRDYILEWQSPNFHVLELQPFAGLLLMTFGALALSPRRVSRANLASLALLALFGYAALQSTRHIPIFALIAAPLLSGCVWDFLESRGWAAALGSQPSRGLALLSGAALLWVIATGAAQIGRLAANQVSIERANFPAAAVDFLQARGLARARLFNSYQWGGYLIWRLYPEARVFIDGRADVYGDTLVEKYVKAYRGGGNWREFLEQYDVQVALIEKNAPLATVLAESRAWKRVYADEQAVIFARADSF